MTVTIRTEQLTKRYGPTTALDSLDLEIEAGEVFGYLGPNGAGKSTTIALLLGLIRPTSGRARIFGLDVWRDAPAIHRRLAYVPSEANLWPSLTGAEALRFLGNVHGSVDEAYRDELIERFELAPDKKIRAYSHGNRQKVLLIAALASRAELLLLDEPTTGLDPLMEQVFRACVREAHDHGQTVVLSSHILSEVEAVCDRVAMLRAGRIIETGQLEVLRGLAALRVSARLNGAVPDLSGLDGVTQRGGRRPDHRVRCQRVDGAVAGSVRRRRGHPHDDAGALAGGALRGPLRHRLAGRGRSPMTAGVTEAPPPAPVRPTRPGPDSAIGRRAFRQLWIGATVCALGFGLTVVATATSYVSTFPTAASREQLVVVTSGDAGLSVLLGPITEVGTVGGYTVYKIFVFLTTVGALWALLAATRLLRGEEDAGRWQLVLAGATRPARATAATLAALGAAVAVVFLGTAVLTFAAGRNPDVGFGLGESVIYGLSLTVAPAVFAAVGAFTSQLGRTRRLATGLGMAVFGVTFVVRMVGDAGPNERWMLWLTPFGWTELMRPFTVNDPWPLVPAALTVALLALGATALASRRDAGDGVITGRDVATLRPRGLGSAFGLSARLELPVLAAWCLGAVATAAVLGIIAVMTTAAIPSSMRDTLDKFGVQGSFTNQYFGVAFLFVATVVALLPASQVAAACDEEMSGRLVNVLSRTTTRGAWFAGRLALSAAAVVSAAVVAGFAAWASARTQGVDVALRPLLGAGLNVIPTALVTLGIGAVMLSLAPRAAAGTVYGVVIWSITAYLLGSLVPGLGWIDKVSLIHYMALAPAEGASATTVGVTLGVAAVLCGSALALFTRRDVRAG